MANPTTNFGWVMPTSADLVTDLPADFNVFGQGVDTSMQYLLGGTTGQILSKTSATNMAFTWIANDTGDITGVTAGTGISGGGTSGTVTVTNSMATAITTNGDIIYGTGSGTFSRLGIGSSAQVLTVASGVPSWATPASGGKVLQVVQATTSTPAINVTSTMATTNVTAAITPTLASSTILVMCSISGVRRGGGNSQDRGQFRLMRGATSIVPKIASYLFYVNAASVFVGSLSYNYIDSPATTSATTYTVQFANGANVADFQCQYDNELSTIQLLEIGA